MSVLYLVCVCNATFWPDLSYACAEETEALNASSDAGFCYRAAEGLSAAVMQQLQKAATDAAIAQELVRYNSVVSRV